MAAASDRSREASKGYFQAWYWHFADATGYEESHPIFNIPNVDVEFAIKRFYIPITNLNTNPTARVDEHGTSIRCHKYLIKFPEDLAMRVHTYMLEHLQDEKFDLTPHRQLYNEIVLEDKALANDLRAFYSDLREKKDDTYVIQEIMQRPEPRHRPSMDTLVELDRRKIPAQEEKKDDSDHETAPGRVSFADEPTYLGPGQSADKDILDFFENHCGFALTTNVCLDDDEDSLNPLVGILNGTRPEKPKFDAVTAYTSSRARHRKGQVLESTVYFFPEDDLLVTMNKNEVTMKCLMGSPNYDRRTYAESKKLQSTNFPKALAKELQANVRSGKATELFLERLKEFRKEDLSTMHTYSFPGPLAAPKSIMRAKPILKATPAPKSAAAAVSAD